MKHTYLLIATLTSSHLPPPLNVPEVTTEKILMLTEQILKGTNLTGLMGGHWWRWLSGRTSVFGRRTFPVLRLTCS